MYDRVVSYVEGAKKHLQKAILEISPASIAVNYSQGSEVCDGLTHGMFLTLRDHLEEIGFADRLVSAEKLISRLRARKTETELERMRRAVGFTVEIFDAVADFIRPGLTEKDVAAFMLGEVESRGLELAWDPTHCPAVFTGPETAGAHYKPTDRKVERGHVLNMDFGVKVDEYCSDMQRTFYVLEEGETQAPPEVLKGFETIVAAIEKARLAIRPGGRGLEVDQVARRHVVSRGFEEFPHALGHQVGRFVHDGTALLGPAWEKYADKPLEPLDEGMVFTIEPRLFVQDRGTVTVEEMVVVTAHGAEYLGPPQKELLLV